MFAFRQIVNQLVLPPSSILLILLAGFGLSFTRFRRLGKVVLVSGIVLYYSLSISPTADILLGPLESLQTPLSPRIMPRVGTLVVLTGGASATTGLPVTSRLGQSSTARALEAVRLYYLMNTPKIVVSGGSGNPFVSVSEAALIREFLIDLRVTDKNIIVEERSRDTYENGKAIQRLQLKRPLILITSAGHMPRALNVFRSLGMNPLAAPCDFKAKRSIADPLRFFPSAGALSASRDAIYEYLATWWYKITGRL